MEDRVGGALLVRGYRDVRLTEAGRAARRSRARAAARVRRDRHAGAAAPRAARPGLLRIGFGIASILGLLPDVLLRFRRAYPDVQLQLRDMSTPDQIERARGGDDRRRVRPATGGGRSAGDAAGARRAARRRARPAQPVESAGGPARRWRRSRSSSSRASGRPASTITR